MHVKDLTSEVLLNRTKSLVAEERRITLALIEHLEEIQRRMLYAELGYGSLWDFATRELGLSEGSAQRRIQAMRLVRDVPEAKLALESGKLSLSNAAKVQSFRQAEKKLGRKTNGLELVAQVSDLSQRECEQKLFEISPEALPRERERIVSADGDRELKIVIGPGLHEKLQRLKGLLAHAMPDATYEELLDRLATQELARLEKKKGITHDADPAPTAAAAVNSGCASFPLPPPPPLPAGKRVYLPAAMRKEVWKRAGGQCEVRVARPHPQSATITNTRCSSRYRLEVDHITPLALGGLNELANLRLACWHHNQQQAREKLGSPRFTSPLAS